MIEKVRNFKKEFLFNVIDYQLNSKEENSLFAKL